MGSNNSIDSFGRLKLRPPHGLQFDFYNSFVDHCWWTTTPCVVHDTYIVNKSLWPKLSTPYASTTSNLKKSQSWIHLTSVCLCLVWDNRLIITVVFRSHTSHNEVLSEAHEIYPFTANESQPGYKNTTNHFQAWISSLIFKVIVLNCRV